MCMYMYMYMHVQCTLYVQYHLLTYSWLCWTVNRINFIAVRLNTIVGQVAARMMYPLYMDSLEQIVCVCVCVCVCTFHTVV